MDITGISNEPWQYRYVGTTVAKIMKEENLCLEEYLEKYKYCDTFCLVLILILK